MITQLKELFLIKTINAQEYVPLSKIEGFGIDLNNATSFGDFLNKIFLFGLAIAAIAAVVMIIWGGVLYMGSESVFSKSDGKQKIIGAIGGLILALLAILILNTINPSIVSTSGTFENNLKKQEVQLDPVTGLDTNTKGGTSGGNNNSGNTNNTGGGDQNNGSGSNGNNDQSETTKIQGPSVFVGTVDGNTVLGTTSTITIPNKINQPENKIIVEGLQNMALSEKCNNCDIKIANLDGKPVFINNGSPEQANYPKASVIVEQSPSLNKYITGKSDIYQSNPSTIVAGKTFPISIPNSNISKAEAEFSSNGYWIINFN